MKKFLLIFLLLSGFFAIPMAAKQRQRVDSLLHALSVQKDTSRLATLVKLSQSYWGMNEDSAFYYGKLLLRESKQCGNAKRESDAYTILGSCFYHMDKVDSAFAYKWKAIELAQKENYQRGLANGYSDVGLYFKEKGDLDSALKYVLLSAGIREKINDQKSLGVSYHNLGLILIAMNDTEQSLNYYVKAEHIFEQQKQWKNFAAVLNNIASHYDDIHRYDTALILHLHAYHIRDSIGDKSGMSQSLLNLGVLYRNTGDYANAEKYLLQSYELKKVIGETNSLSICLLDLAFTKRLEKKFPAAEALLKSADSLVTIYQGRETRRDLYLEYSRLYSDMKRYDLALNYLTLYQEEKDSIFNEQKLKVLNELQVKFQTAQKEKENLDLKAKGRERDLALAEEKTQNVFLFSGVGILALILAFSFYAYRSKKNSAKKLEEKNNQITAQNNTLKELNKKLIESEDELTELNHSKDKLFSIISHDLSNPVKAISNYNQAVLAQKENMSREQLSDSFEKLDRSIQPLQGFLDNLLHWSALQRMGVNVRKEIFSPGEIIREQAGLYDAHCALKKISMIVNGEKNIMVNTDKNMLRLVLRNLISNAIKFSPENTQVVIRVAKEKNAVSISITDHGAGIPVDVLQKIQQRKTVGSSKGTMGESGTGLGLGLVKEYLSKMGGELSIESSSSGSTFTAKIIS
ncbi:MAG: tetratricopeptide repeat-containing sensor histidine kinase [Bacteroidetes bacterium]|nr:tetratricopeptide repeat-containing sensor histidine kinase [Bacteroidota bacterium]